MFSIDFTKPWLYDEVIFFNQGNLATNNILRCSVVLDGYRDLKNCNGSVTFRTASGVEVVSSCKVVDPQKNIIEIKFPSNALEVGINSLEILIVKTEDNVKITTPSPIIKYEVWRCMTTGNGVAGDSKYPVLVDLIDEFSNAMSRLSNLENKVDNAISKTNNVITEANKSIFNTNTATRKALDAVDLVNVSLASGTNDLEVKSARRDLNGVDHDSLSLRIASDFKGLKEAQDMAYSSDSILDYNGVITCEETKSGALKDLKISGKSLVNLWDISSVDVSPSNVSIYNGYIKTIANGTFVTPSAKRVNMIKPSTDYTVIFEVSKNTCNGSISLNVDYNNESCFDKYETMESNATGTFVYRMRSKSDLSSCKFLIRTQVPSSCTSGEFIFRCVVLEGDYSQNSISYFDGILNVGNGVDGIEISTVKADGNLFDGVFEEGSLNSDTGANASDSSRIRTPNFIFVDNSKNYSLLWSSTAQSPHNALACVVQYDTNKNYINKVFFDSACKNFKPSENCKYIKFRLQKGAYDVYFGKYATQYVPYEQDKKTILFKDTDGTWKPVTELRGIDLNSCDTIEKHSDGKYYFHVKNSKTKLVGDVSENWTIAKTNTNTVVFKIPFSGHASSYFKISQMCDKFVSGTFAEYNKDIEFQMFDSSNCFISILKSKLSTQDAQGLKAWLKANPVTVVYQLAQEKVHEVNPLDLESYEKETMWIIKSGTLSPRAEFKVTSNIQSFAKNTAERVSRLEDEIYKMNLANFAVSLNVLELKSRLEALESPRK